MSMSVEMFIALRYLKARKNGFFSILTTFIAVGGTLLGVAALIITLAVMSGFQTDIRDKILGVQSHIVVTRVDGYPFTNTAEIERKIFETDKNILGVSPYIYRQAIIRNLENGATSGLIVKAVDYKMENEIAGLSDLIIEQDVSFNNDILRRQIILGNELARSIDAYAGSEVALMFPSDITSIPQMYKFNVIAVLHSGMYDYDSSFGFIDIKEAQELFSMPHEAGGIGIRLKNIDKALAVSEKIQNALSESYLSRAWIQMNRNLFSALRLEKIMMFLILGLIILVAAFNIISNLLLLSVQKFKEIGILSAMGFSKFSIAKIFFYEGLIVGLMGAVLGIFTGLSISLILKYFDIFKLPKGVYYVDRLPISILPQDIFLVSVCAFAITVLAAIYPAYQVSKLNPLEAIRAQ